MAGVQKILSLKDGFSSTLDKYIEKLSQSVAKEEALTRASQVARDAVADWTSRAEEWSQAAQGQMKAGDEWENVVQRISNKTLKAKDDIEVLAGAFREFSKSANSWSDIEIAFARFNEELAKNGGYWTEAAEQFDKYDLLMDHGFDKLIKNGLIVKDGMGELQEKLDEIASDAEEADAQYQAALERRTKQLEEENAELEKLLNSMTAAPKKVAKLASSFLGLDKAAQRFKDIRSGAIKAYNPFQKLSKTVLRMGLSFLTIRRLANMFMAGVKRAPDEIMGKFTKLKETMGSFFAGTTVAAMDRMGAGVERLNQAFNSPAGQKFARAMELIGRIVGDILSVAFERFAQFVEWIGNHIEPIAIAAGVAFAIWAVHMTALAIATAAANLPLIAMIGLIAAIAAGLSAAGVTSEEVFGYIGGALGGLYAFAYNVIADLYNWIASFAEFFANVFNDPIGEIGLLFLNLADVALGALERVAQGIDKVFKTNLAGKVTSWRTSLSELADKLDSGDRFTIDRMEGLDYNELIAQGYSKGSGYGAGLSDYALKNAQAQDIKSIAQNTGAIKDTLQEEDLTALIDMAERQFVSNVNLTAQTPVITVNGANTGNTEADRNALARAIAQILSEQISSMPTTPSPAYYGGGG